jgi:hypothetical protein
MHALWKSQDVPCRSDGTGGRPLQLQHQHGIISHAAGATETSLQARRRLLTGLHRMDFLPAWAGSVLAVGLFDLLIGAHVGVGVAIVEAAVSGPG